MSFSAHDCVRAVEMNIGRHVAATASTTADDMMHRLPERRDRRLAAVQQVAVVVGAECGAN